MSVRTVLSVGLLLLWGCGDDGTGPGVANVTGVWRFSFTDMTGVYLGNPGTCSGTDFDFEITQSRGSFSAVQQGTGTFVCVFGGPTVTFYHVGETLEAGEIDGASISFRIGTLGGGHSGTVSGSSMTGTAHWQHDSENGAIDLTGTFSATRL